MEHRETAFGARRQLAVERGEIMPEKVGGFVQVRIQHLMFVLILSCAGTLSWCQSAHPADGKTHAELLVSTQWLGEHLSDRNLVIVDVGMGGMESSFVKAHIPGAREFGDELMSFGSEELL